MDEYYQKDRDIRNLLNYIVRDKKNGGLIKFWDTRGTLPNVDAACEEMIILQRFMERDNGRRMYHLILSFDEEIKDISCVREIAVDVADYLGKNYQLLYGIHTDTKNYHIHIAMNAVCYRSGKKWHKEKKEFLKWTQFLKGIMQNKLGNLVKIQIE